MILLHFHTEFFYVFMIEILSYLLYITKMYHNRFYYSQILLLYLIIHKYYWDTNQDIFFVLCLFFKGYGKCVTLIENLFSIAVEKLKARSVFLKITESFSRHLVGQGGMKVIGDDHGFDPSCTNGMAVSSVTAATSRSMGRDCDYRIVSW